MSNIWFSADLHLGSKRTLELSKRPFKTINEMDGAIISNWNSVVDESDKCFIIGDFGNYDYISELNGEIVLITGNYEDKDIENEYNDNKHMFKDAMIEKGFSKVFFGWYRYFNSDYSKKIYLTHEPKDCKTDEFNLFGHVHKLSMVKEFGLNVGQDCHNFFPINLDTVEFYKNGIENFYDENVFMTKVDNI